ncbi:hypothetical protein CY34DRAFT_797965 [Suillus luteus UH-Slu-Lm8-n1]|uniref:Uncharacterized protein n=1 Tax=Suillus luteus UH-Slu-Lm8-n1 TaxID=930992 RepID=A0A0D0AE41_9AGAM|nr:hypothetical protein CY34DRAFT_797965 [Suillus luteus UH-Slu-Lm8-n1]
MHFTALVALVVVASSVLGSSVPAPTLHSRVFPKRDSDDSAVHTLLAASVIHKRDSEVSTVNTWLAAKRSMGDVKTGSAVAHDNDSNGQDGVPVIRNFAERDICPTCVVTKRATPY